MNLKEIMHGGRLGLKNVGSVGMRNEPCFGASIDRKVSTRMQVNAHRS
jgi:hypothetical protein